MKRYVIQFYKTGSMRYISHLDLLRLFKRSFKRMQIDLIHSQGFNPHPKMSFVQPLSLGYSSVGEYLDFETEKPYEPSDIINKLSAAMPEGIGITACRELSPGGKTLAALVEYATYRITLKLEPGERGLLLSQLTPFLAQSEIIVEKLQKKTGKLLSQDIRPMISEMKESNAEGENSVQGDLVDDNLISFSILVKAGSNCNLNPEVLISAFYRFCGISYVSERAMIERVELYYTDADAKAMRPILQYGQ